MAKIGYTRNGVKRRTATATAANPRKRRRRRNPLATVANPRRKTRRKRRNSVSAASVKAFAKRNGLKLTKTSRRNGVTSRRQNGLFGNTKADAKKVTALLAGGVGVKTVGRMLQTFTAKYLAQLGLGAYNELVVDAVLALLVAPKVASKFGGSEAAVFARYGGLLAVAYDIIEIFAPDLVTNIWNPFGGSGAVVLANGQTALPPASVAAIVNSTNASATDKAKVAGAMRQLQSGGGYGGFEAGQPEQTTNSWVANW